MEWNSGRECWESKTHPPYISVYLSIGGWKPQLLVWVSYSNSSLETPGHYEPWQTGWGCNTRESAISQGKDWAEAEELEFRE